MHIKRHKGKLYAFNGYWEDARYTPGATPYNSSSAQVLRLDAPNGSWAVDLDTGAHGTAHMKGNIMKSVVFRTDAAGRALPSAVSLLVAASFAGQGQPSATPSISVWVRNDDDGEHAGHHDSSSRWQLTSLLSGASGGRRVPRDIEIHRDGVTGVDRIFLLCGDSGVISGAFSSASGSIAWDAAPEFPARAAPKLTPRATACTGHSALASARSKCPPPAHFTGGCLGLSRRSALRP